MKTDSLNFNRIGLLFKKFFVEQKQRELILWSIMAMVFMLIRNSQTAIYLTILIGGMFYAARVFREIHLPTNGNAFFMLPALQLEKMIVGFVIGIFYYLGMMLVCYSIGNLLGTLLNNLLAQIPFFTDMINLFRHKELKWVLLELQGNWNSSVLGVPNNFPLFMLLVFIYNQSIYLLGSIYFKRSQVWKTLLSVNLISILLIIITIVELACFKGNIHIGPEDASIFHQWGEIVGRIGSFFLFYLLPPFFWIVSYFRLTEKQV